MNEAITVRFSENFAVEKKLKSSERSIVCAVRNKDDLTRFVYREFDGEGEVYRRLEKVNSPYLPEIEAVEEENGRVYVLEEYVPGDTLLFLLKGGTLTEEQAHKITEQLGKALAVLHGAGIVHRDVKPENVILRGDNAVLIDFDASRVSKVEKNMDTQVMGTAGYAAPEQYGYSQTDARADIYSLGVMLNIMLTGQHPSKKLATGKYLPIISKCIEVNVDRRYSNVDELLAALEKVTLKKMTAKRINVAVLAVLLCVGMVSAGIKFLPEIQTPQDDAQSTVEPPPADDGNGEQTLLPDGDSAAEDAEPEPKILPKDIHAPLNGYVHGKSWPDDDVGYISRFYYDLDGDSEYEEYIFGLSRSNYNSFSNLTTELSRGIGDDECVEEHMAACVWQTFPDGHIEMRPEFAEILENPEVRLWRRRDNTNGIAPYLHPGEDDVWEADIMFMVDKDNVGEWAVEVAAEIDGVKLGAMSSIEFYSRMIVYEDEDTETCYKPEWGYDFGGLWAGMTPPYRSFFDYDLDGDGTDEKYVLGISFYNEAEYGTPVTRMQYYVFNGDYVAQRIVPCVWRMEEDGRLVLAEEIAKKMKNTEIRFWRMAFNDVPAPEVEIGNDGPWSASATVFATNENNDYWVFEAVTEIGGESVASASVLTFNPAE